jgi:hypothetical protein
VVIAKPRRALGRRHHPHEQRPENAPRRRAALAEGKSEIIRILKRYVAREICRYLPRT